MEVVVIDGINDLLRIWSRLRFPACLLFVVRPVLRVRNSWMQRQILLVKRLNFIDNYDKICKC